MRDRKLGRYEYAKLHCLVFKVFGIAAFAILSLSSVGADGAPLFALADIWQKIAARDGRGPLCGQP